MHLIRLAIYFVFALTLTACGTKLLGKLYSLDDGTAMDFQIERSNGTGGMFAQNAKTGENFTGQYTSTYKGGGVARTSEDGSYNGSTNRANGTLYQHSGKFKSNKTTFIAPTDATARGVLIGDKGTVIELYMQIRPGIVPKGHGEGVDNNDKRYQVQF